MFKKNQASKEQVKLMIGLTGPSGAGKTYSALQLAYGITGDWSKIAVADTENRSALYYAGDVTGAGWEHIDFPPTIRDGYHPNNWIKLIEFVESDPNTQVLILDSISHEWQGCLQLIEQLSRSGAGNSYVQWAKVTPLHNAFIDKMRNSRLHIIATIRSVTEYVLEANDKGKQVPKKVGMKGKQREDLDYEFGIIFDIDISHYATSSKDRTGIFLNRTPFLINSELGRELMQWARDGQEVEIPAPEVMIFDPSNHKHANALWKWVGDNYKDFPPHQKPHLFGRVIGLEIRTSIWDRAVQQTLIEMEHHDVKL